MNEGNLKIKEIKDYVRDTFGFFLLETGFEFDKKSKNYFKQDGEIVYGIDILVTSWSKSYSVTMSLWVRHVKAEQIQKEILDQAVLPTLNQDMLERIFYSPDGRKIEKGDSLSIWITERFELVNLKSKLIDYHHLITVPYFNKFRTLYDFDNYINNEPFDYSPAYVGGYTNDRCMRGLIIAKLIDSPKYAYLVSVYDELIKKTISEVFPDSIENYNKVKIHLSEINVPN